MSIPTPHFQMKSKDEVAKTVLMPGDPLRAKFVADTFLKDAVQINSVRNTLGYTGLYNEKPISVISSGMGMPSIGIYSFELFKFYDVDRIIRIGSCGAYSSDLALYDVLLVDDVWSESSFASVQCGYDKQIISADSDLNEELAVHAQNLGIEIHRGRIHSTDVFYRENFNIYKSIHAEHGCIAAEMEAFALFSNARVTGKKASCLLTVSDSLVSGELTSSEERQNAFTKMMKIALEMAK